MEWLRMIPKEFCSAVVNHLWQSTAVIGVAWLLALVLRKNHARVRYWIWFAASVKFLLPFSLLIAMGEWLRSLIPSPNAQPVVSGVVEQLTQPFGQSPIINVGSAPIAAHHGNWLAAAIATLWACGVIVIAIRFARGWCRVYTAKHGAMPIGTVRGNRIVVSDGRSTAQSVVDIAAFSALFDRPLEKANSRRAKNRNSSSVAPPVPIRTSDLFEDCFERAAELPVLTSPEPIEPGVVGIFRPALLLPEGILEKLTAKQLHAILAHEVCHVRRRDNLTFAIHMVVEALFWFHPAVWWIGIRLIEERERACDEAVIQAGGNAEIYAEGILGVCKLFAESPLGCVSGVTGADLKKRIVRIMKKQIGRKLNLGRKVVLAAAGSIAVTAPIIAGFAVTGHSAAQSPGVRPVIWDSGQHLSFDVASVRQNTAGLDAGGVNKPHSNFPIGSDDSYTPNGGEFSATNLPLISYIIFAYKITTNNRDALIASVPDWVLHDSYNIEARTEMKDVTKDQMRLMMQSLLADRFKLTVRHEQREVPVFAAEVDQFGKLGPQLRSHVPNPVCVQSAAPPGSTPPPSAVPKTDPAGFPLVCNGFANYLRPDSPYHRRVGGGNVPLTTIVGSFTGLGHLGRPVVDRTGLTGGYDFFLDYLPDPPAGKELPPDASGPDFVGAVKSQLGIKLVRDKAGIDFVVVDHIERPTPN